MATRREAVKLQEKKKNQFSNGEITSWLHLSLWTEAPTPSQKTFVIIFRSPSLKKRQKFQTSQSLSRHLRGFKHNDINSLWLERHLEVPQRRSGSLLIEIWTHFIRNIYTNCTMMIWKCDMLNSVFAMWWKTFWFPYGYRTVCYTNIMIIESFKYLNIDNLNLNGNKKCFQNSPQNGITS